MNRFFLKYQKAIIWTVVVGFLLGGIGLFTFQRFSPPPRGSAEEVVLVVEGSKFNRQDLGTAYENLINYYIQLYQAFGQDFTQQLEGTAGRFNRQAYLASAAEGLIRQTLLRKEARRLRVSVPRAELDQAVESRYQQTLEQFGGDEEALRSYLESQGLTMEEYRRNLRSSEEQRLLEEALRKQVVGPIEPTEEDLLTYYQEHQDRYQTQPERIRLAYIKVSDAALADELVGQAQAPDVDFIALAQEHSEDEQVELDWFSRGGSGLPQAVEDVAFSLAVGEVRLVEAGGAYYIIKLLDHQDPVVPPLEEIRDQVEEDYIRDEDSRRWNEWYENVRSSADVEVRDPLVQAFLLYQQGDVKGALDVLLSARERGEITDLYLDYYIGRMYERLYTELATEIAELEGKEELSEEEQARLEELQAQQEEYRQRALEYYLSFADTGEGDEQFFNRVIALDPQNPQIHYRLAELYKERGDYVQADRHYQQALDAAPEFVAAYLGQGDVAMAMELYVRAIERYQRALELQTGSRTIELRLAGAYVRDQQYEEARPLLEGVLADDPDNATALVLMGDLLLGEGQPEAAIEQYQAALRRNPTSEVQLKLARALLAAGRYDDAKREFQDLVRRFPYRGEAYAGLGDVYRELGDDDRALELYQDALRRTYDVAAKEAIAEKIVELAPDDLGARFRLAEYYREQYKYDAAIRQYQEILSRDPENVDALIGLGDCYVPKTQYDTALQHYSQALERLQAPARRLVVLDKIVACEERRVGPQGELTEVALEALWQRAQIHRERGELDQAKADLQRIYDANPEFRAEELVPLLLELGGEVQTPPATLEVEPVQTAPATETPPG